MPLQTETLAILNELERPLSGNRRQDQLHQYVRDVAAAHRGVYPADDETAITQAWLFAGGGTNANPSVFTIGTGLTMSINTSGAVAILATDPASTSITVPGATTRGGVRRLLTALGVAFTG